MAGRANERQARCPRSTTDSLIPQFPRLPLHTDVLIVGSGPAGSSAALFLSTPRRANIMITKYRWTANTPRAHITNQRTMEIFRDLGIEDQVLADATPHELIGDTVFCTSIAGEEIGRILHLGHPSGPARPTTSWPRRRLTCDIPQTYLEPILVKNATMRGTQTRFSTEYLSHTQDADGVDVRVRDRLTGADYTIRAKYLIGADGARSKVAADIDLPMEGQMDIAGSMNITFKADIADLVGHRPVGAVLGDPARVQRRRHRRRAGPDGPAVERMADRLGVRHQRAAAGGRRAGGHADRPQPARRCPTSTSRSPAPRCGATTRCTPRTCSRAGCSAPATPSTGIRRATGSARTPRSRTPTTWPGSSPRCCAGRPAPSLLDTYSAERAPVARQIVLRANKSSREFVQFFEVLGRDEPPRPRPR